MERFLFVPRVCSVELMSSTLTVVQSPDQRSAVPEVDVVIEELLKNVPVSRYDEVYGKIRHGQSPSVASIPLYDVLWQRFAVPFNGFPDRPNGISHLVVLYEQFVEIVDVEKIDTIECIGVDPYYCALVSDFARNNDLNVAFELNTDRHRVVGFLRGFVSLVFAFVDSLLSMVLRYRYDFDEPTDVIFVPHLNRFGAMRPVINAAEYSYKVVAPVSTVEWLYHRTRGRWGDAATYDPIPLGVYTSPVVAGRIAILLARLGVEELVLGAFRGSLRSRFEREFGIDLLNAINQSLGNTYPANLGPIPNLWLGERLLRVTGASRLVIGSLSLRQQTMLVAADRVGVKSYHVPHTVPTHYDTVPKTNTEHIVPSEIAREYHEESDFLWTGDKSIVALGRPLLATLAKDRSVFEAVDEPLRVVVATQPFDDAIRSEFVSLVVSALQSADEAVSIVIKTHPVEDPEFYAEFESKKLTVTDESLHEHLAEADLVFVVNTNVGLEAVALGTPIVSVNLWEPFINSRPYQQRGPIPLLRSRTDLEGFVSDISTERIGELRREQTAFFDEQYSTNEDVAEAVAEYIQGGRAGSD